MAKQSSGKVRIIGGSARSRRINFQPLGDLRPTPDRVRETLFNWLGQYIVDSICLDLFSGSGALAMEALSRGARRACLVESHPKIARVLQSNLKNLGLDCGEVFNCRADSFLKTTELKFSIVFIDPPYSSKLLQPTIDLLAERKILQTNAFVYVEQRSGEPLPSVADTWHLHKQQKCGEVMAFLYRVLG